MLRGVSVHVCVYSPATWRGWVGFSLCVSEDILSHSATEIVGMIVTLALRSVATLYPLILLDLVTLCPLDQVLQQCIKRLY